MRKLGKTADLIRNFGFSGRVETLLASLEALHASILAKIETYLRIHTEISAMRAVISVNGHGLIALKAFSLEFETTQEYLKRQGLTDSLNTASYEYLTPDIIDGSQYDFPSINHALFAEHIFRLPKSWKIVPGIRYEFVKSNGEGSFRQFNTDLAGNILYDTIINESFSSPRSFFLLGIGLSKTLPNGLDFYANWSQNYRAINFNDLRIVNPNFRIDPNLEDEKGYNMDLGIRGSYQGIRFDMTAYYLRYANRIGFLLQVDSQLLSTYRFRSNIGKAIPMASNRCLKLTGFT